MSFSRGQGGSDFDPDKRAPRDWVPEVDDIELQFAQDRKRMEQFDDTAVEPEVLVTGGKNPKAERIESWENAPLNDHLIKVMTEKYGFRKLRPIQAATIPQVLAGEDVRGHAETGGGKTLAFVLPIMQRLMEKPAEERQRRYYPSALVLSPTRELAQQTFNQFNKVAQGTDVKPVLSYGQISRSQNLAQIGQGCDILVGTAGRIMDFVSKGDVVLKQLRFFVLDEADKMLRSNDRGHLDSILHDSGFLESKELRQTLMFSATMGDDFQKESQMFLKKDFVNISNGSQSKANARVEQIYVETRTKPDKNEQLEKIFGEDKANGENKKTLVFVQRKKDSDFLAAELAQLGFDAKSINGDRPQNLRTEVFRQFDQGIVQILVGTDVCARGWDVAELDRVINYDLPECSKEGVKSAIDSFVHRIGRTGRTHRGTAISFVNPATDGALAEELVRIIQDVEQEVPDWLMNMKSGGSGFGGGGGFGGSSGFGSTSAGTGFGGGFSSGPSTGFGGFGGDTKAAEPFGKSDNTASFGDGGGFGFGAAGEKKESSPDGEGSAPTKEFGQLGFGKSAPASEPVEDQVDENADW